MEEKDVKNLLTKLYYNISEGGSLEVQRTCFLQLKRNTLR